MVLRAALLLVAIAAVNGLPWVLRHWISSARWMGRAATGETSVRGTKHGHSSMRVASAALGGENSVGAAESSVRAAGSQPATYRDGLGRIMPTVFVAGPAKSGSTFIWDCVHASFHPERVCRQEGEPYQDWSDAQCGAKRFVLPALTARDSFPALSFHKESEFWRYWGKRKQESWARYGGPRLPISIWELGSSWRRWNRFSSHSGDGAGPKGYAGHRALEDACLEDSVCPAAVNDSQAGIHSSRLPYTAAMPQRCFAKCVPCDRHPGWMNGESCAITSFPCESRVCAPAYVPKRLRHLNFSASHARSFSMTAFPAVSALAEANISAARVATLDGSPGIFPNGQVNARLLTSLTTGAGKRRLRFIIGLRDPFDLAFSLWAFLSSIGKESQRVEVRMQRALDAIVACNETLADNPMLLLSLPPAEHAAYRGCLEEPKTAGKHFYLFGGLYGLHLLSWLHHGAAGPSATLPSPQTQPPHSRPTRKPPACVHTRGLLSAGL